MVALVLRALRCVQHLVPVVVEPLADRAAGRHGLSAVVAAWFHGAHGVVDLRPAVLERGVIPDVDGDYVLGEVLGHGTVVVEVPA